MIYFTSDLHFRHKGAISNSKRPYLTVDEMDAALVRNWNKTVNANDDIYVLGDFTLKGSTFIPELVGKLKGRKYLIRGNHDKFASNYDALWFEWVKDYHELRLHNACVVMSHYQMVDWNGFHRGSFMLHGHIHSTGDYNNNNIVNGIRCYDVGVDANDYKPVSLLEIIAKFT